MQEQCEPTSIIINKKCSFPIKENDQRKYITFRSGYKVEVLVEHDPKFAQQRTKLLVTHSRGEFSCEPIWCYAQTVQWLNAYGFKELM